MIVPMKKITLVVLDREREVALNELRDVGVMHVERREASSPRLSELQSIVSRLDTSVSVIADFANKKKPVAQKILDRTGTLEAVERIYSLRDERRAAQDILVKLTNELERLSAWGAIDLESLSFLSANGITLIPFEMARADYASLNETVRTILLERDKKDVRCVVVSDDGLVPQGIPAGARQIALPEASTAEMISERDTARNAIATTALDLAECNAYTDSILALKADLLKEIEFESIRAGMPLVSIGEGEMVSGATDIAWLTGFVPSPAEKDLANAAKAHGWAFVSEVPADEDNVPTQIKNNRFVNIISPLLDFLGTVPGYRELDISLWFLLFFGIFFAMIFGDGGYGAIIALLSLFGIISATRKKKAVHTGLYMFLYLGIMTIAWGVATCTWFGIPVAYVPDFLKSIAIPAFSNENPESALNIKIFCFTLGLVQISLAHVIGIIRNRKTLKALGEVGSLTLAIGMFFVVLNLVVDAKKYPLNNVILGMVFSGFLLNFIFVNYAGNILQSILESLKNIISMILGVVNMFADIMSYIRLWAVGLAGAAISATVNEMAGPMFGGLIVFAGMLLLVFGHGLNSIMNVLSVLVHGVRLNTLEFSTHLGLTWSGFKYEPFSETVKK